MVADVAFSNRDWKHDHWCMVKGRYVDLYSALNDKYLVLTALRHGSHSLTYNQHPCLPLAFVRVHQMALPQTVVTTSSCSLLLIYRPRKDERLSWPSWVTYSGRFTVYPYNMSPFSCRSSAGQREPAGQRPTFYRWATKPNKESWRRS